jgi:ankyrin repeat protein
MISACCVLWCCDQSGCTALLLACANGHLDVARWLVTVAGSDARAERDNVCIPGAIRVCVMFDVVIVVGPLMCVCSLRGVDQDRATALLLACENGHLDVARWLVTDAGSDARAERSDVSCRGSCRRLYVSLS